MTIHITLVKKHAGEILSSYELDVDIVPQIGALVIYAATGTTGVLGGVSGRVLQVKHMYLGLNDSGVYKESITVELESL